jgi:ATP-dependent RNA helicase DDX31/DBP7
MAAEDTDLGLNLVFTNPASSSAGYADTAASNSKKKRKNKYDRRRERGRLAKEAKKLDKTAGVDNSKSSGEGRPNGGNERSRSDLKIASNASDVKKSKKNEVDDTVATKNAELGNKDDVANEHHDASKPAGRKPHASSDDAVDKIDGTVDNSVAKAVATKPTSIPLSAPASKQKSNPINQESNNSAATSRRHRPESSLDEEEERSKYLSEFHARPRDLDRGERASKNIKASVASDHIFGMGNEGTDSGDDETVDDAGGAGNETKDDDEVDPASSCPFQKIGVHPNLASTLTSPDGNFRLKQPTIVQCRSIAALLPSSNNKGNKKKRGQNIQSQKNLFIQSETGSGKTLAYLLPILQQLAVDSHTDRLKKVDRQLGGTRCIILCPTRELATQTYTMCNNLCSKSFSWIVPGCFSGGEKRKSEKARLRKGISILIATPGRLLDHVTKTESLLVSLKGKLEWLVLDEADRLLEAGLGGQVEQIMQHLRSNQPGAGPKRDGVTWRSVLVSATVTPELEGLARTVLGGDGREWEWARGHKNGTKFNQSDEGGADSSMDIGANSTNNELDNSAPRQLAQLYMMVSAKLRLTSLIAFLAARASKGERTVVFLSTCDSVDYHHALFTSMESILGDESQGDKDTDNNGSNSSRGIFGKSCPIYKLHGDIPHTKRLSTLKNFSDDQSAILLATDVAARGLNFPSLDWIVQYDPPCETKDYVHRAGRSARAGQAGHALLFLLPSERQYIEVLQLRGLQDISALSLSATLTTAADLCRGITQEGEARARGNTFSDGRGEAFTTAIQTRLEETVHQDDLEYKAAIEKKFKGDPKQRRKAKKQAVGPLLEGARKAFSAFVRAYPAKEKAVKHIFNARALHLGHIARSLALKDAPKMVSKASSNNEDGEGQKMSGEKRKSRLAFNSSESKKEKDDDKMDAEDEENERYMSLLGDALHEQKDRKSPSAKKRKKTEGGGVDARKRMLEAAKMMQQGLEYM